MRIYAGVALGRIVEGAPVLCTRFSDPGFSPYTFFCPAPPTEHRLSVTRPEEITSSIPNDVNLKFFSKKSFSLSYPIATSHEQQVAFGADLLLHDHCTAFLNGCRFGIADTEDIVQCLFIDLTPGQVAAIVKHGNIKQERWHSKDDGGKIILGDVDKLSVQEVLEKLVEPIAPKLSALLCVGILRPEGAFSDILPIRLELSYGSAVLMYRRLDIDPRRRRSCCVVLGRIDWGIQLADGRMINITSFEGSLSADSWYYFTTSKDQQVTATLRFVRGTTPCGSVFIDGITPSSRGNARIRVKIQCDGHRTAVVTVQELASNLNVVKTLDGGPRMSYLKGRNYGPDDENALVEPVFGIDGVIGELSE